MMSDRTLRWVYIGAAVFLAILLALHVAAAAESSLMFHPTPDVTPHVRLEGEVMLETVYAAFLPGTGEGVCVVAHGNAGNIVVDVRAYAALRRRFAVVVAFDYRGYGRSTFVLCPSILPSPRISQGSVVDDCVLVLRETMRRYPGEALTTVGFSLGGGVLCQALLHLTQQERRGLGHIYLVGTFSSAAEVASKMFTPLVAPFMTSPFRSTDALSSLRREDGRSLNGTVAYAEFEEIIPDAEAMALKLAAAAGGWKVVQVPGATHNTLTTANLS